MVDLFVGGGGASTGIEQAIGRHVDIAINHDADAIGMHEINHPQTRHYQADVWEVDPLTVTAGMPIGLLHASPDCTHHSQALGGQRAESHVLCDGRQLHIQPDTVMDFRALPFADGTFHLVVFDPPHLKHAGPKSWLRAKYGVLGEDWRDDLQQGFAECFRVLASNGTLIFKWAEDQVKVREVLELVPHPPLFGHPTGRKGLTHWMVFMKPQEQNE